MKRSKRKEVLFVRNFHSVERVEFMRSQPCEVTKRQSDVVHNAHTKSRGAGGTYEDIVPLSWEVHHDFDVIGELEFEQKYRRSKQSVRDCAPYYQQLWEESR